MRTIKDKVAVVTGGGSGLGRTIALRLAGEGAHLHLVDLDLAAAELTAQEIRSRGVQAEVTQCDLSDPRAIDALGEKLIGHWGAIDILVNNAGVAWYGPTTNMTGDEWDRLLAINLHAPIRLTMKLLPALLARPEAHVVNMASICGFVCGGRYAAYHVSKFGLVGFSEAIRAEFGRHGLGVTAVCPGPVLTSLYKNSPCGYRHRATPSPPAWLCTTADRVAAKTIRAIYRNQAVTFVGLTAHLLHYSKRLAPWVFYALHTIGRGRRVREKLAASPPGGHPGFEGSGQKLGPQQRAA
jgi:short-subunit dehydrogenase